MNWVLENKEFIRNAISTGVLIIIVFTLRTFILRKIRNAGVNNLDFKKKWVAYTKNITVIILLIGLLIVWASELQAFAISLVAVAAAVVIATKELILCLLGGTLRVTSKPFRVGDRIEINGFRGDVVDYSILTTVLDEIGPGKQTHQYTGKKIVLPNSLFLSTPILNESALGKYTVHTFSIPCSNYRLLKKRDIVLNICETLCSEYISDAKKHMDKKERAEGLETPNIHPRVTITLPSHDKAELIVRVPVPIRRVGKIEQSIVEKYCEELENDSSLQESRSNEGKNSLSNMQ